MNDVNHTTTTLHEEHLKNPSASSLRLTVVSPQRGIQKFRVTLRRFYVTFVPGKTVFPEAQFC
jgi:hypothetical protein